MFLQCSKYVGGWRCGVTFPPEEGKLAPTKAAMEVRMWWNQKILWVNFRGLYRRRKTSAAWNAAFQRLTRVQVCTGEGPRLQSFPRCSHVACRGLFSFIEQFHGLNGNIPLPFALYNSLLPGPVNHAGCFFLDLLLIQQNSTVAEVGDQ